VRALLDLLRENEAAAEKVADLCESVLGLACSDLKILDPEVGDTELIMAVADQLAKLP
jgi:hypothetical protein